MFKRRYFFLWVLVITSFLISCSPKSTPPGASSIGGAVDEFNYSYHYWEEGLAILIWHDFSYGGESCSGTGSTEDPVYRLECAVEAQDGRRFDWKVHTGDGVTADMWIDDQSYDLSQGSMFLVSSQDGGVEVVQIQRDFSQLTGNYQMIAEMANSDLEVANFVRTVETVEEPTVEPSDDTENGDASAGLDGVIDVLTEMEYSAGLTGQVDQPFFSVPGQIVTIDGEDVQFFEYPDAEQAEAEASQISPDANSVGTSMISWVSRPHFYLKDNLIVLYVGENESLANDLSQVLGQPVAEGQQVMQPVPEKSSTESPLSFEAATYMNEANGFDFDYPAAWRFEEQVLGSRGSGALFTPDDESAFSAIVYLWDPKHDLDAYSEQRKLGWSSSSIVTTEEELMLAGGQRALLFEIQGPDGSLGYSLLTTIGEKYLELFGTGDPELLTEIFQTVRVVEPKAVEPASDLAAFENQVMAAVLAEDLSQMQALMGEAFGFAFWGSEGYSSSPEEAIQQLQQIYLPVDQAITFDLDAPDLSVIVGPPGILSVWDPARNPVDALFSTGWGSDGLDEAFLIIIQKPDGSYAWDGIVLASGSYGGFAGLYEQ